MLVPAPAALVSPTSHGMIGLVVAPLTTANGELLMEPALVPLNRKLVGVTLKRMRLLPVPLVPRLSPRTNNVEPLAPRRDSALVVVNWTAAPAPGARVRVLNPATLVSVPITSLLVVPALA